MDTQSIPSLPLDIVEKVLTDHNVRQKVVTESHYWFFHTYFSHYITYQTADFQREIFQLSEDENIKNLVIIAFRGSGKTTIVNLSYPLWAILGKQQKKFILIVGLTQAQAQQHLKNIRKELESNELLRKDMGPFQEENEWNSASLYLEKHDAKIVAVSMEQSIRGIRHGQYRPDLIICDDIEDSRSVKTRESREKTFNWLTSEVIPAGDINTRLVMIGNLLHEDSVLMRLKEKIKTKKMKGMYKAYPILLNGKPVWSGKFPNKKSVKEEEQRVANYISWKREYELVIVPDEGQIVLPEDIHYYDDFPEEHRSKNEEERVDFRFTAIGTDLAISQSRSADYTAFVPMKVFKVGKMKQIYILPQLVNARMDFSSSKENLKALAKSIHDHPKSVKIYTEDVGYQQAFDQEMKRDSYTTKPVKIVGDKHSRLCTSHHYIKTGHVLFPRKGCEQLIQQIMGFGVEKHDDLMDAFTIAVNEIMKQNESHFFYHALDNNKRYDIFGEPFEPIRMDTIF